MMSLVNFSEADHSTWKSLFRTQARKRDQQLVSEFSHGLKLLNIDDSKIPNLELVNQKLFKLTGWQGVYVKGFEEAISFFQLLSEKKFPIGHFIRDPKDLSYTPEPDVFHDLYGHIPFYTDEKYAQFSVDFAKLSLKYSNKPEILEKFQRLFWFAVEFGLVLINGERKIFGAGIASSNKECEYALSSHPKVIEFDIQKIANLPFRIDILQETLFLMKSPQQLYGCLNDFEEMIQKQG